MTPIAGRVEPPLTLAPDPVEVANAFDVPLGFLLDPGIRRRHFRTQRLVRRDYWAIPCGERFIRSATAAMLTILDRTQRESALARRVQRRRGAR